MLLHAGQVGLHTRGHQTWQPSDVVRAVQAEVFPYERNWNRRADLLGDSLSRLDALWVQLRQGAPVSGLDEAIRAREAAAMLATSRWMYRSALARTESRGMHRRLEHAGLDPAQRHRLVSAGLDEIWLRQEPVTDQVQEAGTGVPA